MNGQPSLNNTCREDKQDRHTTFKYIITDYLLVLDGKKTIITNKHNPLFLNTLRDTKLIYQRREERTLFIYI